MQKTFQGARILLVHAHPDDETINNGATMAKYAALGAQVTLVTCTRGEEGEVLVPELAHIAASDRDELGTHREVELADAMKALGVTDFRFLGAPDISYRDSGMMDTPPNNRPDVFWQADLQQASRYLVAIIDEIKPHVLITYDEIGGYGHPDHIQAHRVAMEASKKSQWQIPKIYWNTMPKSVIADGIEKMKALGSDFFNEYVQAKMDAMAAHKTQIALDGPFFALSNNIGLQVWGNEYYTLVHGQAHDPFDNDGRETDLLAGIDF
jgi:N-acetyl-1-D-myo-inositol-2-amino-2-deoxy-alpha-D-glucopyranoside deacetylase